MFELRVVSVPVGELVEFEGNPRRGDVDAIAASLEKRGQYKPIVVNAGSKTGRANEVLAGNHTLRAARGLGWSEIQCVFVDVAADEAAQIVAADNRIADLGGYDLGDLLAVLEAAGDLDGTGYSGSDFDALVRELAVPVALSDVDAVPSVSEGVSVSRLGDVWQLGEHRLIVGSCADVDLVDEVVRSVDPAGADCVWTDPPYGVSYVGGTSDRLTIKNDGLEDAVAIFGDAVGTIMVAARPGAPVYIAHADLVRPAFQAKLEAAGFRLRQTLIWVKNALVMGRADYHWKHEPIIETVVPDEVDDYCPFFYGFAPGGEGRLGRGGENWHGDNKATTVFNVAKPQASREHPTMKPVELIEPMLRNSCRPGGVVLDLFGGSGSTLIAAHHAGVKSVLVELDEKYADVICRRFQQHTGVVPVRDGVEVSFVD
ncbi:DNA modification methylase [Leucobacter sp. OH1287]|uniref:DNA modification methylase n=1 Tax=Leucobacter sp. OH1287 TaxID=2491049 RepID=UPI0018F44381|nr:DNA modification methylase [Leucobacter sp. OH1287]